MNSSSLSASATSSGQLLYATKYLPKTVTCDNVVRSKGDTFSSATDEGRQSRQRVPISAGSINGHLLLLHDLSYIDARSTKCGSTQVSRSSACGRSWIARNRRRASCCAAGSAGRAHRSARIARVPRGDDSGSPRDPSAAHRDSSAVTPRASTSNGRPKTLHTLLDRGTARRRRFWSSPTASPTSTTARNGEIVAADPGQRPRRGARAGHARVRRHLDRSRQRLGRPRDRRRATTALRVPPDDPAYTLRRVWLIGGGAGRLLLWLRQRRALAALPHRLRAPDLPRERLGAVRGRQRALRRRRRAGGDPRRSDRAGAGLSLRAAAAHDPRAAAEGDHHHLLAHSLAQLRRPSASARGARRSSTGLLGSTILGFHTQFHCNNFLEAVDRFMESRIDREHASVTFGGHETMIRPYPISIEWPPAALAAQAPVRGMPRRRAAALRAAGRRAHRRRHRALRLHEGHPGSHARGRRAADRHPEWTRQVRLHPGRRADAQQARAPTARCRRRPIDWPTRSTPGTATTTYKPILLVDPPSRAGRGLSSCSAPPTCASSRACTTA